MKRYYSHIMGISSRLMHPFRSYYHKNKAKRFNGEVPSIICNNCLGGVMLHDLGLPFNTPTINLFFRTHEEFIYFVQNIEEMQTITMHEIDSSEFNVPVGEIEHKGHSIRIVFQHYKDFQSGYDKWKQRMKRMDLSKIVVLLESPDVSPETIEAFSQIKYKKAIISRPIQNTPLFYVPLDIYNNWHSGKVLEYKSLFSIKRWVDDWDYISFLNKK